ncbi:MFS family permease [Sphingomonas naasensis]|uniref:MFS transporter n=1 Tax=Sphingomonas naasensis TaxID=1344951 RepID=A0A4S1WBG5_9SPHN|nr:MFS transporter [Sphingomonas naasensis]NIJ21237.1 MFS family permease [Sphingomonas naasensis]TGX38680.1 MFS transporter [Sphingomonas naasensis]
MKIGGFDRTFALLFTVMLAIAAGNTALQSVLPALGRSLGAADSAVAAVFSVSALLWVIAAPYWANRSDRHGRRAMVLLGVAGFTVSLLLCGIFLALGINGVLGPIATFVAFIIGRVIYGSFGSAAPPAVQAIVAGRTSREERTRALTLLASAFGLGTILGPALAPYLVLGHLWPGGPEIGLAGPAFVAAAIGAVIWIAVLRLLPRDEGYAHGAAVSYPSIGGQGTGAAVTAATASTSEKVGYFDARVRAWMISGLVVGHAQAMTGQAIGFLIIDRLGLAPIDALQPTGLVLMMGAGSALLAQWGLIPLLDLKPRALILSGAALGMAGCVAIAGATSLYGIALGYALTSLGMGLARPGYTAGSSLAVGPEAQGSVAGKVTSINGAAFVLGPSLGVGMYELWRPMPYLTAAAALACLLVYAWLNLRPSVPGPGASPAR